MLIAIVGDVTCVCVCDRENNAEIESYENVLEKISQISQKMLPAFGTLSTDIILR